MSGLLDGQDVAATIPSGLEFDVHDRMRKALRFSGMKSGDVAGLLGLHRNTVGGWLRGQVKPDTRTLMAWAALTGVPYSWLVGETEAMAPTPDGGGDLPAAQSRCTEHLALVPAPSQLPTRQVMPLRRRPDDVVVPLRRDLPLAS